MEPMIGEIRLFAFGFAPYDWELCNGQVLNIGQYQALYSLIGVQFGGDGRGTFGLPKLNDPQLQTGANFGPYPYLSYYICTNGLYPSRPQTSSF